MIIRHERPEDRSAIWELNTAAFKNNGEADLVAVLRNSASQLISLVAEDDGQVVGHILFSPVRLEGGDTSLLLFGLGPMAVIPERQKQGIGSALVKEGLKQCAAIGCDAVVVLGHPDFYPRFGFDVSRRYGIFNEYDVPDNFFMIMELRKGSLDSAGGVIKYHPAFNEL